MRRALQWIILIVALSILAGSYLYIKQSLAEKNAQVRQPRPPAKEQPIDVSVIHIEAGTHTATVSAFGTAMPRYALTLTAKVSGEVHQMNTDFEMGQQLRKHTLLAKLHNTDLQSKLSQAQKQVAQAELSLQEEQRLADQAVAEWQAAGLGEKPDSDLVWRKPQLALAKMTLADARVALKKAQEDVAFTQITTPFDALVVERLISPGSYVTANTAIATLYSTDRLEITLSLAASDWFKLPDIETMTTQKWPVSIHAIETNDVWQGYVIRASESIDQQSRLRDLVIAIEAPFSQTPALRPGSFVNVSLQGRPLNNLWRLPNTALSQKSEIWYVNSENRLESFASEPVFVDAHAIYIKVPDPLNKAPQNVLVNPFNSYLNGMLVKPVEKTTP